MDKQEKQIEKAEKKMEKKGETPVRNEKVIARLDKMFDNGWYWHGNEPCHQVAYLYDAAGAPEKRRSGCIIFSRLNIMTPRADCREMMMQDRCRRGMCSRLSDSILYVRVHLIII